MSCFGTINVKTCDHGNENVYRNQNQEDEKSSIVSVSGFWLSDNILAKFKMVNFSC